MSRNRRSQTDAYVFKSIFSGTLKCANRRFSNHVANILLWCSTHPTPNSRGATSAQHQRNIGATSVQHQRNLGVVILRLGVGILRLGVGILRLGVRILRLGVRILSLRVGILRPGSES